MDKTTLYRKHAHGIGVWEIWAEGDTIYYRHAVVVNGSWQTHTEQVFQNQSGRTLEQQIKLQIDSRVSRMLDKGYKRSYESAVNGATNQLGLPNPMLAHPITRVSVPPFSEAFVQRKYNGHRCLITRSEGHLFGYTRKGKAITSINHIIKELDPLIGEGMTLDGELYVHGMKLQGISSLIKRPQPDSAKLKFHAYDMVENDSYKDRLKLLTELFSRKDTLSASLVDTIPVYDMKQVYEHFRLFRQEGYEGAMLRLDLRGYEDGKRSNQLLKVKEREDADFLVLDVKPGKNDVGILVLRVGDGDTFDCLAPGSVPEKQEILANKNKYIGRRVTIAYAELTQDGKPFHGVALQFVEDL